MEKKNELMSTLQGLLTSHEESDVFSASEDFSSKITEILSELTSRAKKEEPKLDVTVLCEFMTPSENELLWEMLLLYTNSLINTLTEDEENEDKSDGEEDVDEEEASNKAIIVTMLRKVASVLSQYFELSTLTPRPNSFFLVIQSLHNILVPLDEDIAGANELKQSIARLCERAWHQDEVGCELLMTQLIPFLLLNVLDSCNTRDSDVKRLYAIRDAFALLDYEDESIQTIQGLLLRCFTDPSFLKIPEGRRFLSFTFALHADLHNLIVGVMKPQLGTGNKSVSQAYGDILYRAWRDLNIAASATTSAGAGKDSSAAALSSSGEEDASASAAEDLTAALLLRASLEDNLQDMAHHAIHARERKYFKSLRLVLNVFHENKNNKSVDSLLLKVYGPIMWRSLRCAHPMVRMQAAIIFFDCFPLQSSDHTSNIRETEQLLQKQFDLLHTLLKDGDHRVRAVAALGVCKVLRTFWEVIPTGTTHQILSYVVSTLGVDASCANVRASVINGMSELLENPLSHIVLKGLLPLLSHSVHDYSERVRASFLRLLCKIKTTRGFKFYDIVSIDQLCNQLSADVHRPVICSIMTELLLNSFYPRANSAGGGGGGGGASSSSPIKSNEYGVEQIKRCLQFSRSHPEAAMVFYSNLYLHTSVGSSTKMCVGLWNTLRDNLLRAPSAEMLAQERERRHERAQGGRGEGSLGSKSKKGKNKGKGKKRGSKRQHADEDDEEEEEDGTHSARNAFAAIVSLSHQILMVLTALIKSTLKLLLSNATYKLSKEMLLTHVSSGAMKVMLVHLLDFQKSCNAEKEEEEEEGSDEGSAGVATRVQSCISQLLEVIAMVSTISGGASNGKGDKGKGKGKKGNDNTSIDDEDAAALFTAEGILSLYFANPNEGNEAVAVVGVENNYAFSILDAVIALHKAQELPPPPKKSAKSRGTKPSVVGDFILWSSLKDKFTSMAALLCSEGGTETAEEEEEEEVSAEKNLGKRKQKQKQSKTSKRQSKHPSSSVRKDRGQVVTEFCKAVQLLYALLEGKSNAITQFREEVLSSEENFIKILSIFSVMKNILEKLLSGSDGDGDGGEQEKDVVMLQLESSMTLCVKLWLSVLCQRAAMKEDSGDDVAVSRATAAMHITSDLDEDEESESEGVGGAALASASSSSSSSSELSVSLAWMTNTVMAAFQLHTQEDSSRARDRDRADSRGHKKPHVRAAEEYEGGEDGSGEGGVEVSSLHLLSFLDGVLASSLAVLTDALLAGIASETILSHVNAWVSLLAENSERRAGPSAGCCSLTVNALARLAYAIFSTKIRFPLLNPFFSPDDHSEAAADATAAQQQVSMRAFDASLQSLWEASVDCILGHMQMQRCHRPFSSESSGFNSESSDEDDDKEEGGGDGNHGRQQTDNIDLRILYSMLHLPTNVPAGAQNCTKKTQYKFATVLMKRIVSIVCGSASVNEESLEALLTATSTSSSALMPQGEEEHAARKQQLVSPDMLLWPKRGAYAAVLLDMLWRKVSMSESGAVFLLKYLRSLLLEALQRRDSATEGGESAAGRSAAAAVSSEVLLLAVLVKQGAARSPPAASSSVSGGQQGEGGAGAGSGSGGLALILSAVERLMEADRDREQAAGGGGGAGGGGADTTVVADTAAEGAGAVAKRTELSRQVVALLRL